MYAPDKDTDRTVLTPDSSFKFACHDTLPCFTKCCRDVNIYLTPYDILRLRRRLKMRSDELLGRYTQHFLARVTNIPVVQLRMDTDTLYCPFVKDLGCTVYDDRPWACRMFPLDLGATEGEYERIAGRERCLGLLEPRSWTVAQWLENQGVGPYVTMEKAYQNVLPAGFKPGTPMDAGLGKILFFAYDIDRFLEMLRDATFRRFHDVDSATLERAEADDEALLLLAFQYIRSQVEELLPLA